jgi:hypothetical protein
LTPIKGIDLQVLILFSKSRNWRSWTEKSTVDFGSDFGGSLA